MAWPDRGLPWGDPGSIRRLNGSTDRVERGDREALARNKATRVDPKRSTIPVAQTDTGEQMGKPFRRGEN